MKGLLVAAAVLLLSNSAAQADWRGQVDAMAVDVESALLPICSINDIALAAAIEAAYREAGVTLSDSAVAHLPGREPHTHSIMMTGTYGNGHCFVAITSYVSREQVAVDSVGMMGFQTVDYFVSSAYLVAPPHSLQEQLEEALAGAVQDLAEGMSPRHGGV